MAGTFGCLAIYLMVNPVKASYSMAPTVVVCALVGCLTARWLAGPRSQPNIWLLAPIGFLLGLTVDFRLANLFTASGYGLFLLVAFLAEADDVPVLAGACVRRRVAGRRDPDHRLLRRQRRQSVRIDLRQQSRCQATGFFVRGGPGLSGRSAPDLADRHRNRRLDLAVAAGERHSPRRAAHDRQSGAQPRLLLHLSDRDAVLHDPYFSPDIVDPAVCRAVSGGIRGAPEAAASATAR